MRRFRRGQRSYFRASKGVKCVARVDHDSNSMIGKKTSEAWPIAKDETRVEENASANGTIRQAVLAELERTRNLFELMISSRYMVIAGRSVGKMRDAD